jgi:hypothetical protein
MGRTEDGRTKRAVVAEALDPKAFGALQSEGEIRLFNTSDLFRIAYRMCMLDLVQSSRSS